MTGQDCCYSGRGGIGNYGKTGRGFRTYTWNLRIRKRQQERLEGYKALKHAHKTNLLYTFAAVAVAAFMFAICVQYLEAQAYVKNTADEVAGMEIKLTQLSTKNDETKMEIDGSIDYNEVLRVATEELGMVYPKRSQIVEYDAAESEYVKQYKNIPSTGK